MLIINIYDILFSVEGFLLVLRTFERSLFFTTSGSVIVITSNVVKGIDGAMLNVFAMSVKVIEDAVC